ncbi:MAG: SRPBCC domain-containing protein [Candidatus Dormibacteraeota bacterium]|nr:SRPBCC domain-containing protein [Candidatus Dormibacteraeota bacterium]
MEPELVFKALADPTRRELLDLLFKRDGQTLTELADRLPEMTRFGVMKHLRVLEGAALVITRRAGREKRHYLNPVPIRLIHDRWISKYRRHRAAALTQLKRSLEEDMMSIDNRPAQVYTVFIRASRDKVWDAITKPEFTRRYFFGSEPASNWAPGDRLRWTENGSGRELVDGEIIECSPPSRLVHTWIVQYDESMTAEGPSRVTWELEENDGVTRLTAVHDQFPAGSRVYDSVAGGWPLVLSGLKTLVETGTPLMPEKAAV